MIDNLAQLHFTGCGGAGMVCLALVALDRGAAVSGSDMTENANTRLLAATGVPVVIGHSEANLPEGMGTLVRSSAVPDDNPEVMAARRRGWRVVRRGEFLSELAEKYGRVAAVAGSHGKTSVSAILTHILKNAGAKPGFAIGGKVIGWSRPADAGAEAVFVAESDESDGTNTLLESDVLLLTGVDDDHAWNFGGRRGLLANFAEQARQSQMVVYYPFPGDEHVAGAATQSMALDKNAAEREFDDMAEWGAFQKWNACLAVEGAAKLGIKRSEAAIIARTFRGVARRMALHVDLPNRKLIEDYAHHPAEVAAALNAIGERWPNLPLTVVFQPHRSARLAEHLDGFARELRTAEKVFVLPVFAAWTGTGGATAVDLADAIGLSAVALRGDWPAMAAEIEKSVKTPAALAVLGAGDVEKIIPLLKKALELA